MLVPRSKSIKTLFMSSEGLSRRFTHAVKPWIRVRRDMVETVAAQCGEVENLRRNAIELSYGYGLWLWLGVVFG